MMPARPLSPGRSHSMQDLPLRTLAAPTPPARLAAAAVPVAAASAAPPPPRLEWAGGNHAKLLVDYATVTPAVLQSIEGARNVVDVTLFSLMPTGSGKELGDALARKARQGVEVNLVLDFFGGMQVPGTPAWRYVRKLRAAGVNVIVTRPWSLDRAARNVDHRKAIVIDGRTAFIGGMNFSRWFDSWHDVMVQLDGPAAARAGHVFVQRWRELQGTVTERHSRALSLGASAPLRDARTSAALIVNVPDDNDMAVTQYYRHRIATAKRRIWLTTPFIGDGAIVRELAAAARRGVDVRVSTSGGALLGVPLIPSFTRTFFRELLDAGAKVYEVDVVTHAKMLVTDDEATVGSFNASRRSAHHLHELNVVVRDPSFVKQVTSVFERDFGRARHVRRDHLETLPQRAMNLLVEATDFEY